MATTEGFPARAKRSMRVLDDSASTCPVVHLLGRFDVTVGGRTVEMPSSSRRLVAFLALRGRPVTRHYAAGCLWLDRSEDRAQANLRSALWRLRQACPQLVHASPVLISMAPGVRTDLHEVLGVARALIDRPGTQMDISIIGDLSAELLPEWYEDFVEVERERIRQMRLHALEALARQLGLAGRPVDALDAAFAAVAVDPLRESAHRAVMEIHLAEGNVAEALRQFRCVTRLLNEQLGIDPSERTEELIRTSLRVAIAHSATAATQRL